MPSREWSGSDRRIACSVGDLLLLVFVGGELLFVAFLALAQIIGVIAGVGDQLLLGNFMHLIDDFIHELAVMRNQQQRAGIILQIILQPEQREQIEMVRRFVEQQASPAPSRAGGRGGRA